MKSFDFRFEKVLTIKEREKEEVFSTYQESIKQFQEVAEKLYELLKKKEDLIDYQEKQLQIGIPVQSIRQHSSFLTNLEKSISYYQERVIQARNRMTWFEQKLAEKNIEVKQYEKMKEKAFHQYVKVQNYEETKQLDELAMMQFGKGAWR
ncbi:flagellar biosynthesis chaperone [Bacillus coahuilensis p1.1.43]|uniref:Flagellar FliJ protein n=1 Tax=Bacillus coahuilensis p1.1.43 TaxID=1150625 RepID=A0A147K9L9_9BACI|nr:flagellar export protein FliJ [Bacillus coahuilensis]KUP07110.1 flagellar biosynthesis chaperone [Bacillus coahuilensis p1.1.43]